MFNLEKVSDTEIMLVVSGSLYGEAGAEFERRLDWLGHGEYKLVTLDLTMALGITSSAIGKLLSARKRLVAEGKTIRIKGCNQQLFETFQRIKLDTIMEITR